MKMALASLAFLLATSSAWAQLRGKDLSAFQFPEERSYTSADRGYGQYITKSIRGTSQYVLTYDDGPNPITTPKVLDELKSHNVKAIFFIVAENINAKTIPIIKRMLDDGHSIGSHKMHHSNSNTESQSTFIASVRDSIYKINSTIESLGYKWDHVYFRYPYAAYGETTSYHHMNALRDLSDVLFGKNCINFVFWDNDSSDWVPGIRPQEVLENFVAFEHGGHYITYKVKNGSILKVDDSIPGWRMKEIPRGGLVLLHDIHASTVTATKLILDYAQDNGITFDNIQNVDEFRYPSNLQCQLKPR